VVGDDLLKHNYPLIHLVGRASNRLPRMICLRWGNPEDPLIALVGKGVCFDTGGIQIKPHAAMQSMKKDMGGAAHMIALCEMIMNAKLPVSIALWIGACDNSVSETSFLPGDVVKSRHGISVEIGHTDAEGRLILADLLSACCDDNPRCIIDYATLTGAQRVALGMDIPSVFSNSGSLSNSLCTLSQTLDDWIWPLPLYTPYKKLLDSAIADISSTGKSPYGGSILAALFLYQFIHPKIDWIHIDGSTYRDTPVPGRDKGGQAMGLESLFAFIEQNFCTENL
jgi:leucyl aminopeptidase